MTKPSVRVLNECIEIQLKKSQDYQNPASTVKQADYYVNGVQTIYDAMHGKMLRIKSIQETIMHDPSYKPNHEALVDSVKDLINYASFYAAYLENGIPGQDGSRDMFNRPNPEKASIVNGEFYYNPAEPNYREYKKESM